MRFFTNKFATEVMNATRSLAASGLKLMLLNGRRTGAAVTSGGVVTGISTTGLVAGMLVEQRDGNEAVITTNIPAGRTIASIDSGTQLTLSGGATAGSGLTLYFHPDRDFDTVSQIAGLEVGTSPNPAHTGYTPGYGNAGRVAVGTRTYTEEDANDQGKATAPDITYAAAFGPGWVTGAALIDETGGNDASSRFIAYNNDGGFPSFANGNAFPVGGFSTNGIALFKTT